MLRKMLIAVAVVAGTAQPLFAAEHASDPKADFKAFRDYFTNRFPKVALDDFVNGPYSMDEGIAQAMEGDRRIPAL